jgi:U3 small nucleolar RNA-associated protein 3
MVSTRRRKSSDRRGSNVSSGNPRAARDKKKDAPRLAPEEMEDAIEAHYRNRARALDGSDASDTSGASDASDPSESSDEEVLGFGGAAGGVDSEEDDASASSSDLDSEEEMERNTRYGQLLKQAKAIKAKLDIERGERSDSDLGSSEPSSEEDEGADELDAAWGSRKGSYYNADNVDMEGSEEEEDLEAEEKEATRLQKEQMARLGEDDYGSLSEDEDSDDENGGSDEDDEHGIVRVDDVLDDEARDLRASAVRQDALELKALLQELRSSLSEIRGRLGPLLQEVKSGEIATAEGVSYLEAKHLLLMHYVAHLVFYLLLKAEGKSVKDHPVIARLIEIRSYLEKTRPIDKKLKYQIEKLLVAADATRDVAVPAKVTNDDLAAAKPRPGALMVDDDDDVDPDLDGAALNGANPESGTYRPPRLNPVSMELDETDDLGPGRLSGKDRRRQLNASRKASRSQYIQEFAANLAGAPEERKMGHAHRHGYRRRPSPETKTGGTRRGRGRAHDSGTTV